MQFVREQANARSQSGAEASRRLTAVADFSLRRSRQRREHRDQRGFAGAVRAQQAENVARSGGERDVCDRAPAAEMARDIDDLYGLEVDARVGRQAQVALRPSRRAATPERSVGSGPASWLSSAP